MTLTVVTGWSPSGWKQYAHRFVDSFAKFWPADVRLIAYVEEPVDAPRAEQRLLSEIPGCWEFIEKYRDDRRANGRKPEPHWKDARKREGYNFRFDAWKFCRQGFIPLHAAQSCGTELLCWLDADVITHARVPEGFVEGLLPDDKAVAYLGREPKHSEIGFQLYRLPEAMPLLRKFSDLYLSEEVFDLKEWHSAYAFDHARKELDPALWHDLTPGGRADVWNQSPLRRYTDHLKGKRK